MVQAALEAEQLADKLHSPGSKARMSNGDPSSSGQQMLQHVADDDGVCAPESEPQPEPNAEHEPEPDHVSLPAIVQNSMSASVQMLAPIAETTSEKPDRTVNVVCPDDTMAGDTLFVTTSVGLFSQAQL